MKTVIEILDEMERRPAHPITEREAYALFNERSACIAALRLAHEAFKAILATDDPDIPEPYAKAKALDALADIVKTLRGDA